MSGEFAPVLAEMGAATRQRLAGRVFGLDGETAAGVSLAALVAAGRAQAPAGAD